MEDGPMTEMSEDSCGTGTQDTKESDLASLERKSEQTLKNITRCKGRLLSLLSKVRGCEDGEKTCEAPEKAQQNRVNKVENVISKIDNESHEFNQIISNLEDILA